MSTEYGTQEAPDVQGLVSEEVPSLVDFAEEPGGAWPKGWYPAIVVEGYATGKGKIIQTTDELSKDTNSRNLRIAFQVSRRDKATRNINTLINYRVTDFSPARLSQIKELRDHFKGTRGAWVGQEDAQRTSLAIASLGQLEKSLGFRLRRTDAGNLVAAQFVGKGLDVRFTVDDNGYNDINAFSPFGSKKAEYK
jgi:hypothetical protein